MTEKEKKVSKFHLVKRKLSKKISSIFFKEKIPEDPVPEQWKKEKSTSTKTTTLEPKPFAPKVVEAKIKIPFLLPLKRWIAAGLFIINGFFGLASLSSPAFQSFALIFLLNDFVLLDYLWRTSKLKIVREE